MVFTGFASLYPKILSDLALADKVTQQSTTHESDNHWFAKPLQASCFLTVDKHLFCLALW
jgi:hypothetical protein